MASCRDRPGGDRARPHARHPRPLGRPRVRPVRVGHDACRWRPRIELAAFYPADYAPFDLPAGRWQRPRWRLMQRAPRPSLPARRAWRRQRRPGTLLDVGCGRGDLAQSWIDAGWHVLGSRALAGGGRDRAAPRCRDRRRDTLDHRRPGSAASGRRRRLPPLARARRRSASRPAHGSCGAASGRPGGGDRPQLGLVAAARLRRVLVPARAAAPPHALHRRRSAGRDRRRPASRQIDVRPATPLITTTWSLQFRMLRPLLTRHGRRPAGRLRGVGSGGTGYPGDRRRSRQRRLPARDRGASAGSDLRALPRRRDRREPCWWCWWPRPCRPR